MVMFNSGLWGRRRVSSVIIDVITEKKYKSMQFKKE